MSGVRWSGFDLRRWVAAALAGLLILLSGEPVRAELAAGASADQGSFWKDVGLGAGAAVTNIVYIPVKFVYATVGAVVGSLAWVVTLGSTETANAIWEPTLGGNYVLTPAILAGEEKFNFNGQPPMPPAPEGFKESDTQWSQ